MAFSRIAAGVSCLLASAAIAQPADSNRGSEAAELPVSGQSADSEDSILVEGQRSTEKKPSVVTQLRSIILEADNEQLARFETSVCPMIIGMPRDMTAVLDRIIRENVVAVGGKVAEPGCSVNAAVIFIDQPQALIRALYKEEPSFFFTFTPREFYYFADQPRPFYSWHLTNSYTRDGGYMSKVVRSAAASRLYSNIREEMEAGIVVIDRARTEGKTLRQLADFATMHLLLDVKQKHGQFDRSSILSLFDRRGRTAMLPPRFSGFDRSALSGFYTQRENNRTAAQQRQNIAAAIAKDKEAASRPGED
jgi:hypothetical protein